MIKIRQQAPISPNGRESSHYDGMERGERNPSLTSIIKVAKRPQRSRIRDPHEPRRSASPTVGLAAVCIRDG